MINPSPSGMPGLCCTGGCAQYVGWSVELQLWTGAEIGYMATSHHPPGVI